MQLLLLQQLRQLDGTQGKLLQQWVDSMVAAAAVAWAGLFGAGGCSGSRCAPVCGRHSWWLLVARTQLFVERLGGCLVVASSHLVRAAQEVAALASCS